MAKAITGKFGGEYYDPYYGGLKTDLARRQAQGKLTSGAYGMSPEDYEAAYYGITKGEQEARAQQQNYELQKKQGMANLAIAMGNQSISKQAAQGSPIAGAFNLGSLALSGASKGIDIYNKLFPSKTAVPVTPQPAITGYPYGGYSPVTDYGTYDVGAYYPEPEGVYGGVDYTGLDLTGLSDYFYSDFSNILGADTSTWLDFGV